MPITISGNGGISGLGDIDGHDLETATLVVSGDTTINPISATAASLFVDESANAVGINTRSPSTLLEVQGKGDKQVLRLTNPANTDTAIAFNDSTNLTGNASQIGSKSGAFQFVTGSLERLRITSGGEFGINTANPTQLIETRGDIDDSNVFLTTNSVAADSGATIGFQSTTGGWTFSASHAQIKGGRVNGSNGYLDFFTRQSAASTRVMRLDNNGRVGIGTINPQRKLVVSDNGGPGLEVFPGDANVGVTLNTYNRTTNAFTDCTIGFDKLIFQRADGEKARFNTNGNLAFINGNGIDFSAKTPSAAGSDSSVLNDYEEGSFTPIIKDTAGAGGNTAVSTGAGHYIKIGGMCYVTCRLSDIDVSGLNNTTMFVHGLPFVSSGDGYGIGSVLMANVTFTDQVDVRWLNNRTYAYFDNMASGSLFTNLTRSSFPTTSGRIEFNVICQCP